MYEKNNRTIENKKILILNKFEYANRINMKQLRAEYSLYTQTHIKSTL